MIASERRNNRRKDEICFSAGVSWGAVYGQQSIFAGEDGVISHFIDGDGWKTSVLLNNIAPGDDCGNGAILSAAQCITAHGSVRTAGLLA